MFKGALCNKSCSRLVKTEASGRTIFVAAEENLSARTLIRAFGVLFAACVTGFRYTLERYILLREVGKENVSACGRQHLLQSVETRPKVPLPVDQ